jgi:glycosyltransferase involved in cell wall biosynthesis
VTVIVPVYNDAARIATCIEALLNQTYPRDRYEILIVDNGSIDTTCEVVGSYPVTLLREDTIRGSYAARNKAIAVARGEVLAFTDSDCTPAPEWIAEGIGTLNHQQADMVGGNVRFVYSARPSGAEIYDSLSHLKVEHYINAIGGAPTANLFVRRHVIDAMGPFPHTMQSGGDMFWTRQATLNGYKLVFAPRAEVSHPTRRLGALLRKQFRVGKGLHERRVRERAAASSNSKTSSAPRRKSKLEKVYDIVTGLLPIPPGKIQQSLRQQQVSLPFTTFLRVWMAGSLARATTTLGSIVRSAQRRATGRKQPIA